MDSNPAVRNNKVNGVPYHIFAITRDHTTILGSESHPTDAIPIWFKM
jgi:hypothetical protein